jgi:hypothetical protein
VTWLAAQYARIEPDGPVTAGGWIADFNTITSAGREHIYQPAAYEDLIRELTKAAGAGASLGSVPTVPVLPVLAAVPTLSTAPAPANTAPAPANTAQAYLRGAAGAGVPAVDGGNGPKDDGIVALKRQAIVGMVAARSIWADPLGDPALTLNPILENGFRLLAVNSPGEGRLIAEADFYRRGGRP